MFGKPGDAIFHVGCVLVVLQRGNVVGDFVEFSAHQDIFEKPADQVLVGVGLVQVFNLGRAVHHGAPGRVLALKRCDYIPVLDHPAFVIRIEKIRRDPFNLTVVQTLIDMQKHVRPILDGAHNANVANRVALQKRPEERHEPVLAVPDAGGMLCIAIAGVLLECLGHVAVADTFQIQAFSVGNSMTV